MEPVSVALLAALAGGLGGEAGREAWQRLVTLVHRPFRRGPATTSTADPLVRSAEPELTALTRTPEDPSAAQALSTALAVRAVLDVEFQHGLEEWLRTARRLVETPSAVNNHISGGTYHAPVIQSGSISELNVTSSPPPPDRPRR
ncbi:hypothetical protein ABZX77_01235 [Streptomyces sp. NPDC004237]|uniref:hypothetical protein n=1 Tax=Streptomyces sp. NPDC004237 TaxID=3154455 RepID=UPI0033A4B9E2